MKERTVLVQPLGLILLALSVAVALAPQFGASWSGREVWIVAWGLLAYATVAGVSGFSARQSSTREPNVVMPEVAPPDFEAWTTEALRQMRSSEALARCSLITAIPKTLAAARNDAAKASPVTPLERAQLLYSILHASIERLKLTADAASPGDPEGLHYVILHDEYVLGRPNAYIMTHHTLPEATFHRYRRQAIRAVATDLVAHEQLLAEAPQPSSR